MATAVADDEQSGTAVDPQIVASDNAFGLNLLTTLTQGGTSNVSISPLSVALALQMVYNGAAGATQQAMSQTLQLGSLSTQQLNDDNAALQASLMGADTEVRLTLANSLWINQASSAVLPAFIQTNETYYAATLGDLSGAPDNVNAWVASETNGLITQILPTEPPGHYQSQDAIIVNTIYFAGPWTNPFDPSKTSAAPFTLSDGSQTSSEMMYQAGNYDYLQGANFQAIRIPYGQNRLSMLIVLPASGVDLNGFVSGLSVDTVNAWIGQLHGSYGSIALPRFTSTYGASLPPALTTLGMGIVFCPNTPDFSGMAPMSCLSDVEHKTVIEVDEGGTVAAAATSITVSPTVAQMPQFTMQMNHQFFYAIRDDLTGALLFVGTLQNPS